MMKINKKSYWVDKSNYYSSKNKKDQIVLSFSLRKGHNHIVRLQHKEFGKSKQWNTFTITREGNIYQHYDERYYTDFLNVKDGDKQSISIVMENMGSLIELTNHNFVNWLNEECDSDRVLQKKWLGYEYWEKIDDEQLNSLAQLCIDLCDKHDIPKKCIEFNHYHKDIAKFKGIVFAGNYIDDSGDVNPFFDITKFNELLGNK